MWSGRPTVGSAIQAKEKPPRSREEARAVLVLLLQLRSDCFNAFID